MTDVAFNRAYKITAYRQSMGGFVGGHPNWFEELGNGIEIVDHDIKFKVVRSLKPEPNPCEITIVNLNEQTRSMVTTVPTRVRLEVGYRDDMRLLFAGDVKKASGSYLEGVDWNTKLLLGDGIRAFANARVSRSYASGTTFRIILRDVALSLGLELPVEFSARPELDNRLSTNEVTMGWASDEFTRLLAQYGYHWSIQNGRLYVPLDEVSDPGSIHLIDSSNGLIGTPSQGVPDKSGKPPTTTCKVAVRPELNLGDKFQLNSKSVKGLFKIQQLTSEGDTSGDDWQTTIEGIPA